MKIAIMTDMEGVAGVVNAIDWIYPKASSLPKSARPIP